MNQSASIFLILVIAGTCLCQDSNGKIQSYELLKYSQQ